MAFLGPNGAGEASTIDMIPGPSAPDAGQVEGGRQCSALPAPGWGTSMSRAAVWDPLKSRRK
jgi:ABC-type branched-subunit amino acid transport system ATPase component